MIIKYRDNAMCNLFQKVMGIKMIIITFKKIKNIFIIIICKNNKFLLGIGKFLAIYIDKFIIVDYSKILNEEDRRNS
jgi:hypothetical protein